MDTLRENSPDALRFVQLIARVQRRFRQLRQKAQASIESKKLEAKRQMEQMMAQKLQNSARRRTMRMSLTPNNGDETKRENGHDPQLQFQHAIQQLRHSHSSNSLTVPDASLSVGTPKVLTHSSLTHQPLSSSSHPVSPSYSSSPSHREQESQRSSSPSFSSTKFDFDLPQTWSSHSTPVHSAPSSPALQPVPSLSTTAAASSSSDTPRRSHPSRLSVPDTNTAVPHSTSSSPSSSASTASSQPVSSHPSFPFSSDIHPALTFRPMVSRFQIDGPVDELQRKRLEDLAWSDLFQAVVLLPEGEDKQRRLTALSQCYLQIYGAPSQPSYSPSYPSASTASPISRKSPSAAASPLKASAPSNTNAPSPTHYRHQRPASPAMVRSSSAAHLPHSSSSSSSSFPAFSPSLAPSLSSPALPLASPQRMLVNVTSSRHSLSPSPSSSSIPTNSRSSKGSSRNPHVSSRKHSNPNSNSKHNTRAPNNLFVSTSPSSTRQKSAHALSSSGSHHSHGDRDRGRDAQAAVVPRLNLDTLLAFQ